MRSLFKNLSPFAFIIVSFAANAQTIKYADARGNAVKNKSKADTYTSIVRTPDSLYEATTYDVAMNKLRSKGKYADEDLTFKMGEFAYYRAIIHQTQVSAHESKVDTITVLYKTEVYDNGAATGIWKTYSVNGALTEAEAYSNNKANGLYQSFTPDGVIYMRGYNVNGLHEGYWYVYNADSSIYSRREYYHGRQVVEKFYSNEKLYEAYPDFDFDYFMTRNLQPLGLKKLKGFVIIQFTITGEGLIKDPKILMGVNPVLDNELLARAVKSRKWNAAKRDHTPISQVYNWVYDTERISTQ